MEKLPKNIPLFPLPGALLLPNSRLPLNIFEPRYISMVEDTLATKHRLIGMIQPIKLDTKNKLNGTNKFQKVGCAGRIVSFTETEDGRYLITLEGVSRFKFRKEMEDQKPYTLIWVNIPIKCLLLTMLPLQVLIVLHAAEAGVLIFGNYWV